MFNLMHSVLTYNRCSISSLDDAALDCSKQDDGCKLILGLGPTPTSYCADHFSATTKNKALSATKFTGSSVMESDSPMLKLGLGIPLIDSNDSISLQRTSSGGYLPSLLFAPRLEDTFSPEEYSNTTDSSAVYKCQKSSSHHNSHPKKCQLRNCTKGARGSSGFCIGHGGGQRCQKPGCNKGSESRTAYCKSHGGGRRCQHLGCTKSAEGKTDFCISHGGGRRCTFELGCTKAARGRSGLCIRHGGGKRCSVNGCTRSAEGQAGLCISHGGGRRCQFTDCGKGAQGSTMYCKAHGGGRRCVFDGCTKGAEGSTPLCKAHGGGKRCRFEGGCGKSVHGGTDYCVAHGGGKRCSVEGCTKSARGRTDCCVRHGGGRRCSVEDCGKSAQGSTDFCKAHGGGKRCGVGGCEKFARGKCGLCAAHGSMMMAAREDGMIGSGLFKGVVETGLMGGSDWESSGVSVLSECENDGMTKRTMMPSQVLVPRSMKRDLHGYVVTEGRVHGGGLMSLLGGSLKGGGGL